MDELIRRLQERIRRSPAVEMNACWGRCTEAGEVLPPKPPNPPLPLRMVEELERELGFRLPTLVRRLYTEVADGGYGPAWGLYPLLQPPDADPDPDEDEPWTVEGWYRSDLREREAGKSPEFWSCWPQPSLTLGNGGCGILICVDCSSDAGRVFMDDPNMGSGGEARFLPVADSVAEWLSEWLDRRWPEDRYP